MRRSEAHQGVRMIKFLDILSRYEAAEFGQLEAAEFLGIGERTFRRWRQRHDDEGEAGLLDRRLGKVSAKRVPGEREAEVEALYRDRYRGFTAKHFPRASGGRPWFSVGLHLDQDLPAFEGFAGEGAAAWRPSAQAAASSADLA